MNNPISTSPFLCKKMMEKEDPTLSSDSLQTTQQSKLSLGFPETKLCELYCVSQHIFSGSVLAKKFWKSITSIFNESSMAELLELFKSPNYKLFVLLPPFKRTRLSLEVLCAIMVHIESNIPSNVVRCSNLTDPVPMCFNNWNGKTDISRLRGLHIINIATHPQYKRMGYGLRAVQLLKELYEGKVISLEEKVNLYSNDQEIIGGQSEASKLDSPLLLQLSDLKLDTIDFVCVFFSLSADIFSFWKKAEFVPLHIAYSKASDAAVCVMLKAISEESRCYLKKNILNFSNYYLFLLKSLNKKFSASLALSVVNSWQGFMTPKDISREEVDMYLKPYHMKSLEKYCLRLQDLNTVIHIIPTIARLYFTNMLKNVHLPAAQEAILLSCGLQNKSLDVISKDLELQNIQVVGLLNRTLKKITCYLTGIIEKSVESTLISTDVEMKPLEMDLDEELEKAALQVQKQQDQLLDLDVSQYAIKGSEDDWQRALLRRKTLVSIKSIKSKVEKQNPAKTENVNKLRKRKQFKKK